MEGKQAQVQVWFDSQCPLCVKEIALMRRLDWRKRVNFIDIYAADQCPLDPAQLLERFHAQEAGQPIVHGAAAFAVLPRVRARSHIPLAAFASQYNGVWHCMVGVNFGAEKRHGAQCAQASCRYVLREETERWTQESDGSF